jgi:MFS family permease
MAMEPCSTHKEATAFREGTEKKAWAESSMKEMVSNIYHGYYVFAATFVLNFVTIGQFNSSSLYLDSLHRSFPDSDSGTLALVCTIQIVAALASSLAGGMIQNALDDYIGLNWLFFFGGVSMSFGLIWSSYSTTLAGVIMGSISLGLGLGAGLISAGVCVLWFEQSRGTMLLLAISGQGMGNVFFPWLIVKLLGTYIDVNEPWRPTMRWMGLLSFIVCAVAARPMRLPYPDEVEENEKDIATIFEITSLTTNTSYGSMSEATNEKDFSQMRCHSSDDFRKLRASSITSMVDGVAKRLRSSSVAGAYQAVSIDPYLNNSANFARADDNSVSIPAGNCDSSFTLKDVAFSSTNLWLSIFTFIACFASLNAQVLIPKYCTSLGFPEAVGGFAMTLYGLGMLTANITVGAAVDRFGACQLLISSFVTMAMLFFAWPLSVSAPQIYLLAFLFGYFNGPSSSLPIIILADAFACTSPEHILVLNGLINMCKFPGYLLGSAIACIIAQKFEGYIHATALSGMIELLGASMLLIIPTPEEQQRRLAERRAMPDK